MTVAENGAVIVETRTTVWPGQKSGRSEPWQHREIVQICAITVDSDFIETGCMEILVRPKINPDLSDLFVGLTGIDRELVTLQGVDFPRALRSLRDFAGDRVPICMDDAEEIIRENCGLHRIEHPFAPMRRLRPFLLSQGVDLSGVTSGDLHMFTPSPILDDGQGALHDVRSMGVWLADAEDRGMLAGPESIPTATMPGGFATPWIEVRHETGDDHGRVRPGMGDGHHSGDPPFILGAGGLVTDMQGSHHQDRPCGTDTHHLGAISDG